MKTRKIPQQQTEDSRLITEFIKQRQNTQTQLESELYKKFTEFVNRQNLQYFKTRLAQYYGKNFAIDYKAKYNFTEQWQQQSHQGQKSMYETYFLFVGKNFFTLFLSLFIMLSYTVTIWFSNLDLFFGAVQSSQIMYAVFGVCFVGLLIDSGMKVFYKVFLEEITLTFKGTIQLLYQNMLGALYLLIKLNQSSSEHTIYFHLFELLNLFWLYLSASKLYISFRFLNYGQTYENYFKIFDLFVNILIGAHFISIILISITHFGYDNTWLSALNLTTDNPFIIYVYSFYFCSTTIMTVGYGDITPKNPVEMIIVAFIQMFGIIIFAYLINQIGFTFSSLRKKTQSLQKNLSAIEKLRKNVNLDKQLLYRTRSYLINQNNAPDQLSADQQKSLLMKLNEQLRYKINAQNTLNIVKSSIFFLNRWSKIFQLAVASRITRVQFSPEELIYQPQGKQRIYIICSGKIDIEARRKKGLRRCKNILKSIEMTDKMEVSDNCYGYTSVISHRPVKIYAHAKTFTQAYMIQKQKFEECVNESAFNNQYYHQIKDKINSSFCWEGIQVPILLSTKHHYNPTRIYLIRKQIGRRERADRISIIRNSGKNFRGLPKIYQEAYIKQLVGSFNNQDQFCIQNQTQKNLTLMKQMDFVHKKFGTSQRTETLNYLQLQHSLAFSKDLLHHYFESSKDYANYFHKNNKSIILKRLETQSNILKSCKLKSIIKISNNSSKISHRFSKIY